MAKRYKKRYNITVAFEDMGKVFHYYHVNKSISNMIGLWVDIHKANRKNWAIPYIIGSYHYFQGRCPGNNKSFSKL